MKITHNFLVLSNYNADINWVAEYTNQYIVYDRSDKAYNHGKIAIEKIQRVPNVGYNLYDYFTFIIDNYEKLPECTIFAKGNIVPRHISKDYFDRIINNNFFTPIEDFTQHQAVWPTNFFSSDGGFCEINDNWYLDQYSARYFHTYNDFISYCFKNPVLPRYTRFAPGANYIVPKAHILKLPKIFYENLRAFITYSTLPGEAHVIERALYTLWTCNFEIREDMLRPFDHDHFIPLPKKTRSLKDKILATLRHMRYLHHKQHNSHNTIV